MRTLSELLKQATDPPNAELDFADLQRRARSRRRRSRAFMGGLSFLLVVVVGALYLLAPIGGSRHQDRLVVTGTGEVTDKPGGGWRDQSSLPPRISSSTVWTGDELIVWGGYDPSRSSDHLDDSEYGFVYSPSRRQWRPLEPSPIAGRKSPTAVWTGKEVIIWAVYDPTKGRVTNAGDVAAYDVHTRTWRALAPLPEPGVGYVVGAVWTGRELLLWPGSLALDPSANAWRRFDRGPLPPRDLYSSVWTGTEMVISGGQPGCCDLDWNAGAAYNPTTGAWRSISASPLRQRIGQSTVWTGSEMIVWGGGIADRVYSDGAVYDPASDRWRVIADSPLPPVTSHTATWTGSAMIVVGGGTSGSGVRVPSDGRRTSDQVAGYDPRRDAWELLPPIIPRCGHSAAWTGSEVLVLGGRTDCDDETSVTREIVSIKP